MKNGLAHCKEEGIIAVHDGVRPLIHPDLIQKLYHEAESNSAVIPVYPVLESIRKSDEEGSKALDRSKYYTVQTPQCFSSELLQNAYQQMKKKPLRTMLLWLRLWVKRCTILKAIGLILN